MRHLRTEDQSRGQAAALGLGWAQGQPQERAFLFRVSPASLPSPFIFWKRIEATLSCGRQNQEDRGDFASPASGLSKKTEGV